MYVLGSDRWQAARNRGGAEVLEPRSSSLVHCFVVVVSMFWDFGSLHLKALRRRWC